MNVLDLFSGIGGFSLGLERAGMRTVAFCEIDPLCRRVLAEHWPGVPIYRDVRNLPEIEPFDVLACGFPCQPHSTAARGRNVADDLWPYVPPIVRRYRPDWVAAENVPGIGHAGLDRVCRDLEREDYSVWTFDLDTALPTRQRGRHRIIWLAHANGKGESRRAEHAQMASLRAVSATGHQNDPAPLGMDDELPGRMDRLRQLGNAITPIAAELIGRAVLRVEHR